MINPWTCERCGKPFYRQEITDRLCPRCQGEDFADSLLKRHGLWLDEPHRWKAFGGER